MEETLIAALKFLMSPELRAKLSDLGNGMKEAMQEGARKNGEADERLIAELKADIEKEREEILASRDAAAAKQQPAT